MTVEMNNLLSYEQRVRAEALKAARDVLATRVGLLGGSNVPEKFDHYDLIAVAEWILDVDGDGKGGPGDVPPPIPPTLDDREGEWKAGYSEGAHSAVNRYRRLAMDDESPGDRVLSDLLDDNAHHREPEAEPLPEAAEGDDLASTYPDDGV